MKNNTKFVKTVMAAAGFSMAVFFAGCGDGSREVPSEESGQVQEAGQQEEAADSAQEAGQQEEAVDSAQDAGEAYLDGILASDYVNLGEYKGIEVAQALPEVTEEECDAYIDSLLCMNPDRGVIEGDTVNIDYAGTLDGVAFDGGTAAGQDLGIGSGQFVPGFEEGLIGARVGETVEVPLTFPENYHEGLAGKDVVFTVTVNSIRAKEPQELTEAFVERLGLGLQTVEELRQYAYDTLYEEAAAEYEEQVEDAALAAVLEQCEFVKDPPEAMVERHVGTLTSNLSMQASGYGLTLSQMMEMYGIKEEEYQEQFRNQAVEYANQQIAIKAIADVEGLEVTEEEFEQEVERLAEIAGAGSAENMMRTMDTAGYKEYMLSLKVLELLRENAVVKN